MIFPKLQPAQFRHINLDSNARKWQKKHRQLHEKLKRNPLLVPELCQQFLDQLHQTLKTEFTYGGYLEDRRNLWQDSYLEKKGNFIHLGVDFNVPSNTEVASAFESRVVRIDDDKDEDGGWGPRVFLEPIGQNSHEPILVYAHLSENVRCRINQVLAPNEIFAEVGAPPTNGNWYAHLHIQAIQKPLFDELLKSNLENLDGYGLPKDQQNLKKYFPDPLAVISL